jgi:hypothetical protein
VRWKVLFVVCALALSGCASKPAGDVHHSTDDDTELWNGPVTGHLSASGCSPTDPVVTGDISLVVDPRGMVTGRATEDAARYECGGVAADPPQNSYEITGTKTDVAFELLTNGKPFRMDIKDSRRASTTIDTPGAGGRAGTVTYSVECKSCGN